MKIEIHSLEDTKRLAEKTADLVRGRRAVICLDGDLGAGKTTFTQSLGKALGVKNVINSPTFNIMKTYRQGDGASFTHIDAYRLEGVHQDLGFEEYFDSGVSVIEWGGYIEEQLPVERILMKIEEGDGENRTFEIQGTGCWKEEVEALA